MTLIWRFILWLRCAWADDVAPDAQALEERAAIAEEAWTLRGWERAVELRLAAAQAWWELARGTHRQEACRRAAFNARRAAVAADRLADRFDTEAERHLVLVKTQEG